MRLFSRFTFLEGLASVCFNLSAAWLAVVFIAPGVIGLTSEKYLSTLLANLPFGVITFLSGVFLLEKSKVYKK